MADMIRVNVDGRAYIYPRGISLKTVADDIQEHCAYEVLAFRYGRRVRELHECCFEDSTFYALTAADGIGRKIYERSMVLMMLKAAYDVAKPMKPEQLKVEFSMQGGLYCSMTGAVRPTETYVAAVEARMRELCEADLPIRKMVKSTEEAINDFRRHGMHDKVRLFNFRNASKVNVYNLDGFEDYYYGEMVYSTASLKYFKLYPFAEGFVMQLPEMKKPTEVLPFKPHQKLFDVMLRSAKWGEMLGIDSVGALNERITQDDINEVILVQEALQEKEIAKIAEKIYDRPDVKIILIAGPSSSGKTTFSHRLSVQLKSLGIRPHPIPVDDYFVNRDETPMDEDGKQNFEAIEAIDLKQFNEDMQALLRGEEVQLPTYNFVTGKREYHKEDTLQIGNEDILVIEGIHALNDQMTYALEKKLKFKIYISALTTLNVDEHNRIATTDGRLIRRMVRDNRTRGCSALDTIARWPSVRRGEESNIFPYQEEADVMFNSSLLYELAVLKQYAEPVLYSVDQNAPEAAEARRLLKFLDYFVGIGGERVPTNSLLREFIGGGCFEL